MRFFLICIFSLLPTVSGLAADPKAHPDYDYREGDIVFYSGAGAQSDAIRDATGSPYTHCGVVFQHKGQWWVFEAVQPVKSTPLKQFMSRKIIGDYRALRLKKALDPAAAEKVKEWVGQQVGKDYDLKFRWEDEKLYCSELVWKLYAQAGVELCAKKAFKEYNLEAPTVKRIIKARYGGMENFPLDEPVVAPSDIANSQLLVEAPLRKKPDRH